jgi:hypothetical protein
VHPATFGKTGYLKRDNISYFRFGAHSAYFSLRDPDALTKMAAECRNGTWRSANYRVFHIFPNLTVAHFRADGQHWYIGVSQYIPVTRRSSIVRAWIYPAPFASDLAWHARWTRPLTDPLRTRIVRFYADRVLQEDNDVSEKLQSIAGQIAPSPVYGGLEERLGWFEEAYTKATSPGGDPQP